MDFENLNKMGQKVNPFAYRLGSFYTWSSHWFADKKKYPQLLLEDIKIRKKLMSVLKIAGISKVQIERSINKVDITVYVSRPGIVIGRGGGGLEQLKKNLEELLKIKNNDKNTPKLDLKVEPIKEPNLDAHLVAQNIADQLAKRIHHKKAVNQAIEKVMSAGARGVRIKLAGRIAGAEISRRESYQQGTIPLQTMRAVIDYAAIPSLTRSGYIGVKVWICKK